MYKLKTMALCALIIGSSMATQVKADKRTIFTKIKQALLARWYAYPTDNLFTAIMTNNYPAAQQAIADGALANRSKGFQNFLTPLGHAAQNGNLKMVKLLLDAGADVNRHGQYGTPLHAAITAHPQVDKNEIVQTLMDAGADLQSKNTKNHTTPIMSAMYTEHLDPSLLQKLLAKDPTQIYHRDVNGMTLFHYAAAHQDAAVMEVLCEQLRQLTGIAQGPWFHDTHPSQLLEGPRDLWGKTPYHYIAVNDPQAAKKVTLLLDEAHMRGLFKTDRRGLQPAVFTELSHKLYASMKQRDTDSGGHNKS